MSLVGHLYDERSALHAWCADRLAGADTLARAVSTATERVDPYRPPGRPGMGYYATVGTMWGQRLAWLLEPAPPYAAILGAVRGGLLTTVEADLAAAAWPTHVDAPSPALGHRTTPTGWWHAAELDPARGTASRPGALDRMTGMAAAVARLTTGRVGEDAAELALLPHLRLVAGLEDAYRGGPGAAPDFGPDDTLVTDWRGLLAQARGGRTRQGLRALLGDPVPGHRWGYATPTIVHRWAEADLLVGPGTDGGCTLLDVKTVSGTADRRRTMRWLWQALAYAWLDTADRWRVRRIGLWLARHGVIVSWPLDQVEDVMLGIRRRIGRDRVVRRARAELQALAATAITTDGGSPPPEWTR